MKIQLIVDVSVPQWFRRAAIAVPALAILSITSFVQADVPNKFQDGDTLSAQKLNDDLASLDARSVPTGTIVAFGGEVAPAGWAACDGTQLDGTDPKFAALYAVIGTSYGGTSSSMQFNLPDLRGQFLRGWDHGAGADPDAAGRTPVKTGAQSGDHVGTAEAGAFASHSHGVTDPGHAHTYDHGWNNDGGIVGGHVQGGSATSYTVWQGTFGTAGATTGISIQNAGGSETRPSNVTVSYIIKL